MLLTPARLITSGFYRVHLWVLMGVGTFASLMLYGQLAGQTEQVRTILMQQFSLAIFVSVVSYLGAVIWMYEQRLAGKIALAIVAGSSLWAACIPFTLYPQTPAEIFMLDRLTGGLVLGTITTAMLLGHWYLNTPTMKLQPLQQLIIAMAVALGLRMLLCGFDAVQESAREGVVTWTWIIFLSLRWLAGLVSNLGLAWLTWLTLKIPNTQSATGILYAGVILAYIGELTGQLLSARAIFPL